MHYFWRRVLASTDGFWEHRIIDFEFFPELLMYTKFPTCLLPLTPNGACFLVITHSWSLPHGSFFASLQNKSDWCSKPVQRPVVSCAQPGYPVHTCPVSAYLVWRNSRRHHHRSFGWWWSLISENMASTYFAPFLVLLHRFWDQRAQNAMSPKNKSFYY